jgi:hypothetical protein
MRMKPRLSQRRAPLETSPNQCYGQQQQNANEKKGQGKAQQFLWWKLWATDAHDQQGNGRY